MTVFAMPPANSPCTLLFIGRGEAINVYNMEDGGQLMAHQIDDAVQISKTKQTVYESNGVEKDGEPRYQPVTIQQIIELEYTYTNMDGHSKRLSHIHFDVEDEAGAKALAYPDDGDLVLREQGETVTGLHARSAFSLLLPTTPILAGCVVLLSVVVKS